MKTKIENAKIELIAWLNDECPKVWPPLDPYTTADLSHDFVEKLRERLDNIIILKGNSIKEPTAMEMIKEVFEPIQLGENEIVNQALELASKKEGEEKEEKTKCPYEGDEYTQCTAWSFFTNGCADCIKYHKNQ